MRYGKRNKRLSCVAPTAALLMCGCVGGEPGEPDVGVDLASSYSRASRAAGPQEIELQGTSWRSTVTSAHGVLVFPDEASAQQSAIDLAAMSPADRRSWEAELGFTSQDAWHELVNEAEIQLEEERFGDLDPELSLAELRRMGFEEQHSSLYDMSLAAGWIREVVEEDDSRSFELVSGYPPWSRILTPDGYVVIGEELRRYREGALDVTALPDLDELARDVDGLFDHATRAGRQPIRTLIVHTWSLDSGWVYETGSERFKIQLVGNASTGDGSLMTVNHYATADSQRKMWGSWKRRNNYKPVVGMSGEWDYQYKMGLGFSIYTLTSVPVSATYTPWLSPMQWKPVPGGTTNYAQTNLAPSGLWSPGGFDYFYDPVYMLGLTLRGHFTSATVTLTHNGGALTPLPAAYRLRHVSTGKCLYNLLASSVRNWTCWNDPNMRYVLLPGAAGSVRLHHLGTGTCVAVGATNGATASTAICNPTAANQRFYLDNAGPGFVRLRASGQCLYGTSTDGGSAHNWGCWADPGMRFVLDPA